MSMTMDSAVDYSHHHNPENLSDRFALILVKFLRFFADTFFAKRYGHRAVVLETVAAVPGMVAGALRHLRALRRMEDDHGWIRVLLDEAENEGDYQRYLTPYRAVCTMRGWAWMESERWASGVAPSCSMAVPLSGCGNYLPVETGMFSPK